MGQEFLPKVEEPSRLFKSEPEKAAGRRFYYGILVTFTCKWSDAYARGQKRSLMGEDGFFVHYRESIQW